ncbi:NrdR family transcriptional regulator [Desulfoferula mesophila]|uniref:Transcriptional repressor NrdR-like N-terminal domain-containing protein n=1 Tax=Desulfoferula mesophila TaxID=3058419 RepID=A0AAU9EBC8_9BACT|nr:hypothetical protein FAK_12560 [Desulfoferula mesophilus]
MDCQKCKSNQDRVVATEGYSDRVRRRRECITCGHRWTTEERIIEEEPPREGTSFDCAGRLCRL